MVWYDTSHIVLLLDKKLHPTNKWGVLFNTLENIHWTGLDEILMDK